MNLNHLLSPTVTLLATKTIITRIILPKASAGAAGLLKIVEQMAEQTFPDDPFPERCPPEPLSDD
jgi:hypothetical protein